MSTKKITLVDVRRAWGFFSQYTEEAIVLRMICEGLGNEFTIDEFRATAMDFKNDGVKQMILRIASKLEQE